MTDIAAHIDFETRSTIDLRKTGVHPYAEHASTWVWCMSWRVGNGRVQSWRPGDADPAALLEHVKAGGRVVAHNMPFDRTIWNKVVAPVYGWPLLTIEQSDCTMARAQAIGLPASLDMVASVLGLKAQKDKEGSALMMRMCRPRRIDDNGHITWWDEPDKIDRLARYCDQDIEAETEADLAIPHLSAQERRVYELDQLINERGVMVDLTLAGYAIEAVKEAKKRADEQMWVLTDGHVKKCSETAKIVAWLNSRGVVCESIAKGEVEELVLVSQVIGDEEAEKVIRLRRASAKTSCEKFKAMTETACKDGRVRGMLAYHGAATGRWAGRLVQPQNFPRVDPDRDLPDVMWALDVLGLGKRASATVDALSLLTDDVMGLLSKCLRAALIAAPGKRFVGGDFSNIEGRINAWMADEEWKLQAFRDYDSGTGHDLYILAYAKAFGVEPASVKKPDRQIGKVMELALGYQGGVNAFHTMAAGYGVKVSDERADELKRLWRAAHPNITSSWWGLQDAAIAAVAAPGVIQEACGGKVKYIAANGFLFCKLPSGRVIAYHRPRLIEVEGRTGKRNQVEFDGMDQVTKRWGPQRLYGGLQCNNVVQGTARDIMVEAMFRAEDAGLPVVLTVHDELLCEVDEGAATKDDLRRLMATLPAWAEGLPLAAAAWEDTRYVK